MPPTMNFGLQVTARNYLIEALAKARSRNSWNDRLAHWERPASETEEAKIERAAGMVRDALSTSYWLGAEGVVIEPQGSYFNNTNVRQTADQDLRAVHPVLHVEYAPGIERQTVEQQLGLYTVSRTYGEILASMRAEIDGALAGKFGILNLDISGNKATRVLALPGSRAPVDVVPCFRYVWVTGNCLLGLHQHHGVTIISKTGVWTNNFPVQHHQNGMPSAAEPSIGSRRWSGP